MIAIMGAPPKGMLQNSEYAYNFFDSDGMIRFSPFSYPCSVVTDG